MLSEIQKNKFSIRAQKEARNLLTELKIERLNDNNLGVFLSLLDVNISGLVSLNECNNQNIDVESLEIYDLLTDIILGNKENLDFLNQLFFN